MSMFGAAIGRKCYFDQDVHRVFPMMNLLLIGPSGIGKSTAIRDIGLQLIGELPSHRKPEVISGKATKEKLHEDLIACGGHAIVVASELANFFSKERYQEGMIPYITDLLDYAPTSIRTKAGSIQTVEEPSVTIIGGSTKEWLQDQLPSTAAAGGFLPRFFIVKEDHKRQRVPDPSRVMSKTQRAQLLRERADLMDAFKGLTDVSAGRVDFLDYEASDTYGLWYQMFMPDLGVLSPFAARAGAHVLRLSLLLALSCNRYHITAEDVKNAIALYEYSQKKLGEVVVPMSPQGKMLAKVLEVIGDDMLSDTAIKRAMRNYCSSQDTDKLLFSLLQSKDVAVIDGKYKRTSK